MEPILVSTPSRLCLFGEHQDYLGLEVVALAINLGFASTDLKFITAALFLIILVLGMERKKKVNIHA